jgi:hypothetical protein
MRLAQVSEIIHFEAVYYVPITGKASDSINRPAVS